MVRTSFLLVVALLVYAESATPSSPVSLMWRSVSFVTESGDSVFLEQKDDILISAIVTIKGQKTKISRYALKNVNLPVLSKVNLIYSSAIKKGKVIQSVALVIPELDPELEIQEPNPKFRTSFVFRDGELIKKLGEQRTGKDWQILSVKDIKTSN